jgi:sugar phosphate isomerase/epimerase
VRAVSNVALQLWTIRDSLERDLEGSLRRVGELGYDGVEIFQLHGLGAADLRTLLDDCGLRVAGRHARLEALEEEMAEIAAELETLGSNRVAISWIDPEALADAPVYVERFAAVARSAKEHGLELGFHNHWSEVAPLEGGSTFLDLLRELPADLLWLELDLGWVWHGGGDPLEELRKTRGRCPLVHVKDYASREGRDDVPVGTGIVGYDRVIPAAVEAGAEWLVVEEDEVGDDPFGAVETSLRNVRDYL